MEIKIERITDAKLLAELNRPVQELHHQLYPAEFKVFDLLSIEAAFQQMLSNPNCYAFVARDSETAIAYVLCFIKERKENAFQFAKLSLELDQLSVQENYRRHGIATLLLNRVEALAKEKGIKEIELNHWQQNDSAAKFFKAQGFEYYKKLIRKSL